MTFRYLLGEQLAENDGPAAATAQGMQVLTSDNGPDNPLSGLVSDEVYEVLAEHRLLSEKGVRDFQIRQKFRDYRQDNVPAYDAIEHLRREYPYLQFDTIRKIVYSLNRR